MALLNNWVFFCTRPKYNSNISKVLEIIVAFGEVNSSSFAFGGGRPD